MGKNWAGFTIVELLITIVVIAILASITTVTYSGVQAQARASAVASGINSTEKALRIMAIETGVTQWWLDTHFTGTALPGVDLNDIIAHSTLSQNLRASPTIPGLSTTWTYDADSDAGRDTTSCIVGMASAGDAVNWSGVNLYISGLTQQIIQRVDIALDDGDPLCGKLRYGNTTGTGALYQLSPNLNTF